MLRDLRFALHLIVKERWYSAVAVVALALGIGMNATVFTLVNAVLIRGLPFKDSHNLYMIGSLRQSGRGAGVSFADLHDWRAQTKTFAGLGGFAPDGMNLSDERTAPQQVRSARVTANTFALLGQPAVLGRDFAAGDDPEGSGERRHPRLHALEDAGTAATAASSGAPCGSTAGRPRSSA